MPKNCSCAQNSRKSVCGLDHTIRSCFLSWNLVIEVVLSVSHHTGKSCIWGLGCWAEVIELLWWAPASATSQLC